MWQQERESTAEEGRITRRRRRWREKKVRDVEADGTEEGKERGGHGKEESKIDVKYVGIKAY